MVQTGDPTGTDISLHYKFTILSQFSSHHTGTGKGGSSIWGKKFEDTFQETLKVEHHCLTSPDPFLVMFIVYVVCSIMPEGLYQWQTVDLIQMLHNSL